MTYLEKAKSYYTAMWEKNFDEMASYFHPQVHLISLLATATGSESLFNKVRNFTNSLTKLFIREEFHAAQRVMWILDTDHLDEMFLRLASILSFNDNLISRIKLFFDTHLFKANGTFQALKSDFCFAEKKQFHPFQ